MKIIVLKFGGTSVGTLKKIVKVAKIITSYVKKIQSNCCILSNEWSYK